MDVNALSLTTVSLEVLSQEPEQSLSRATGFFCRYQGRLFLVTNYHVVSGKSPSSDTLIDTKGRIPGRLCFDLWVSSDRSIAAGNRPPSSRVTKFTFSLNLYIDHQEVWHLHPTYGNRCDVVAVPLDEEYFVAQLSPDHVAPGFDFISAIGTVIFFDLTHMHEPPKCAVMDGVFIVGFPLKPGHSLTRFPIYKAGFIASEPSDSLDPRFYVDGKTKPGMSGSPVIIHDLVATFTNGLDNTENKQPTTNLLGIYSGRAEEKNTDYEAELGIVWPTCEYLIPILSSVS